jgi:Domain of unknown function (DUF1906)
LATAKGARVQVLDYSRGYPPARAIRDAGYVGAVRYLPRSGATGVLPATRAELADFAGAGLGMAFVHQHGDRGRTLRGAPAGLEDGEWVLTQLLQLDIPVRCVYLANDFDTVPSQWPAIRDYLQAAGRVLGAGVVGAYGEYDLLEYLFAAGVVSWGWQTYAWSRGHQYDSESRLPRAHLFQRLGQVIVAGVTCDVNDVLAPDWGAVDLGGMVANWRMARSLDRLLAQINAMAPGRSKVTDGGLGDAEHASRVSDHNPWVGPASDGKMLVTARDFTHDPAGGLDCGWLAARLTASRDPRVKYLIWNREIWQRGSWESYTGNNPHTSHLHVSVVPGMADDISPWNLGATQQKGFLMALTDEQQRRMYDLIVGVDTSLGQTWSMAKRLAGEVLLTTEGMVRELVGAVARLANGDLDTDALTTRLEAASREAAERGARSAVTEQVLPAIERIQAALDADNVESAKAIVAELGNQLHTRTEAEQ